MAAGRVGTDTPGGNVDIGDATGDGRFGSVGSRPSGRGRLRADEGVGSGVLGGRSRPCAVRRVRQRGSVRGPFGPPRAGPRGRGGEDAYPGTWLALAPQSAAPPLGRRRGVDGTGRRRAVVRRCAAGGRGRGVEAVRRRAGTRGGAADRAASGERRTRRDRARGGALAGGARQPTFRVEVRWTEPGRGLRTGEALVPAGGQRGDRVDIWLDSHDRSVGPPVSDSAIRQHALTTGALTATGTVVTSPYGASSRVAVSPSGSGTGRVPGRSGGGTRLDGDLPPFALLFAHPVQRSVGARPYGVDSGR